MEQPCRLLLDQIHHPTATLFCAVEHSTTILHHLFLGDINRDEERRDEQGVIVGAVFVEHLPPDNPHGPQLPPDIRRLHVVPDRGTVLGERGVDLEEDLLGLAWEIKEDERMKKELQRRGGTSEAERRVRKKRPCVHEETD